MFCLNSNHDPERPKTTSTVPGILETPCGNPCPNDRQGTIVGGLTKLHTSSAMRADMHRWVHSVLQVCPQLSECLTICLVCKDHLNASARVCMCLQRLQQTLQTRQRNWKFLMLDVHAALQRTNLKPSTTGYTPRRRIHHARSLT